MSTQGLARAAARFVEAGERHDAGRSQRRVAKRARKPRRAEPVVVGVVALESPPVGVVESAPTVQVEVIQPVIERIEPVEIVTDLVEPAPAATQQLDTAEQSDSVVLAPEPAVYVDPLIALQPVEPAEPAFEWFEPAAEPFAPAVVESLEPAVEVALPLPEAEVDDGASGDESAVVVEPAGPMCPDCALPIASGTDQCPHCALFLPRAA